MVLRQFHSGLALPGGRAICCSMRQRLLWCSVFLWKRSQVCWVCWGGLGVAVRYFLSLSIHISVSLCILRVCQGGSTISTNYQYYQPSINQPPTNHQAPSDFQPLVFWHRWGRRFRTADSLQHFAGGWSSLLLLCTSRGAEPHRNPLAGMVSKYGNGETHRNPLYMEVSMVLSVFNDYGRTPREG